MSLSGFLKDAIYFTVNKYLRKKMTDCILKFISFIIKNIFLFMHLSDLLKGYKYFWGITNILQKKKELIFLGYTEIVCLNLFFQNRIFIIFYVYLFNFVKLFIYLILCMYLFLSIDYFCSALCYLEVHEWKYRNKRVEKVFLLRD